MKNIIMLAYGFPPANFSGCERPFHFARNLPDFGFKPMVISQNGFRRYPLDTRRVAELDGRCNITWIEPVSLRRLVKKLRNHLNNVQISKPETSTAASRFAFDGKVPNNAWGNRQWVFKAVMAGLKLAVRPGFELVWATGPPWCALHAGYILSLLSNKPLVVDIRDPWTYGLLWDPRNEKDAKRIRNWEMRVLTRAARIVYTSPLTRDRMAGCSQTHVSEKMYTITNGFSGSGGPAKRTISEDKCLFCYVGNLFPRTRNPSIVLKGLRIACSDPEIARDVRVQFIGGMGGFEQSIAEYGLGEQVECIGYVSAADSVAFMRGADVLVLIQTIRGDGKDVIGGKAYEYLATGKPILAVVPSDGGDAWLLRSNTEPIITGIEDPQRVADAFRHCWQLWKTNRISNIGATRDISHLERPSLTSELARLFENVLG